MQKARNQEVRDSFIQAFVGFGKPMFFDRLAPRLSIDFAKIKENFKMGDHYCRPLVVVVFSLELI